MWTRSNGTTVGSGVSAAHRLAVAGGLMLASIVLGSEGALAGTGMPSEPPGPPPPPGPEAPSPWAPIVKGRTYTVPVLMYHRITCAPGQARLPGLWVCPDVFDRTMRLLRSHGWDTITSGELADARAAGRPLPRRTFVVMFDDGDRDGYDHAYPILQRYDFEGVFAVVVGRVGVRRKAMTWDELAELQDAGHEIANHTLHHRNMAGLDASGRDREVGRSAELIHRNLGAWPRTFVYPYGIWDRDGIDSVRASHHRTAFTTVLGATRRTTERFTEPRIRISRHDTPATILARLSAYD